MSKNSVLEGAPSLEGVRLAASSGSGLSGNVIATDASLTESARLQNQLAALPSGPISAKMVDAVIRKYSKGAPVISGQDLIDAATAYKIDIRLMLAMGIWESHFGTSGERPKSTMNIFNVGNNDHGGNRRFDSFREGIFEFARVMAEKFPTTLEGFAQSKGAVRGESNSFYCERFPGARDGAPAAAAYSRQILRLGNQLSQYLYGSGKL